MISSFAFPVKIRAFFFEMSVKPRKITGLREAFSSRRNIGLPFSICINFTKLSTKVGGQFGEIDPLFILKRTGTWLYVLIVAPYFHFVNSLGEIKIRYNRIKNAIHMSKFKIFIIILVLILGLGLFFWNDLLNLYSEFSLKLPEIGKEVNDFLSKEAEKIILTPPPIRSESDNPQSFLTQKGVIELTNTQRAKYGLPPLNENLRLNIMAEAKADDMFFNQYFDHISPSGEGVGDLAKNFGYEFIVIGENLALGDYKDDEDLVQAWMDSPGHRENILNERYQEIGVAVKKGVFEGRTTWLAVQHFGLPLSACPSPDEKIETQIKANKAQINDLEKTLKALKTEIQNMRPKRGKLYNQKIEEYNNLVVQYNNLVEQTKALIYQYNNQVSKFNECVATGG
jgi:hypothetical protein